MSSVYGYDYKPAAHLLVTDEDAADFLQSQFSNDLKPFKSGLCTYGLWLDVKGKVVADSFVLCEEADRFRLFSEHSETETIADKLEHHIIADDVVIDRLPEGFAIALAGSGSVSVLQSLGIQLPNVAAFASADNLYIYQGRRSQETSFELWSESADKIAELKALLIQAGVEFVSRQPFEQIRLEAGIPSVPTEIGPTDLPGEGGLVGTEVSLTKGCYLGQEVVARMYNVGRAQRALFLMSGSGEVPGCPVPLFNEDSKQVGELRSAFSAVGGWRGVALLKIRYVAVDNLLKCEFGSANVECLFTGE